MCGTQCALEINISECIQVKPINSSKSVITLENVLRLHCEWCSYNSALRLESHVLLYCELHNKTNILGIRCLFINNFITFETTNWYFCFGTAILLNVITALTAALHGSQRFTRGDVRRAHKLK